MDMPDMFLPELVSPAIRFMYTGRLELKNHNVVKLKVSLHQSKIDEFKHTTNLFPQDTASALGMPLLSKLIEAQINAPLTDDKVIKPKRNSNDPVKQIRKIRKIERKFERVQKKEKIMQEAEKNANLIAEKTLPGIVYNSGFQGKFRINFHDFFICQEKNYQYGKRE